MTVQSDDQGNVGIRPAGYHRPESVAERTGEIVWNRFADDVPPPVAAGDPERRPVDFGRLLVITGGVFIPLLLLTSAAAWWIAGLSGAPVWHG